MFVKFKDGTTMECANPTEQKLFKNGAAAGWLCALTISEAVSSSEFDTVMTPDNVSELAFCDNAGEELFGIDGYSKITSAVVRHNGSSGSTEIQLMKGAPCHAG